MFLKCITMFGYKYCISFFCLLKGQNLSKPYSSWLIDKICWKNNISTPYVFNIQIRRLTEVLESNHTLVGCGVSICRQTRLYCNYHEVICYFYFFLFFLFNPLSLFQPTVLVYNNFYIHFLFKSTVKRAIYIETTCFVRSFHEYQRKSIINKKKQEKKLQKIVWNKRI